VVTSDLDEFSVAALRSAPADSYGIGTSLVTGSGAPTAGMVYKLVSRAGDSGELAAVAKTSKDKINMGGRKFAVRRLDDRGTATHEVLGVDHPPADGRNGRPLLQQFMKAGEILPGWTGPDAVGRARDRHTASMAELPRVVDRLQPGEPAIPTIYE
jgi:nicotinate phosphoribosyltransferase